MFEIMLYTCGLDIEICRFSNEDACMIFKKRADFCGLDIEICWLSNKEAYVIFRTRADFCGLDSEIFGKNSLQVWTNHNHVIIVCLKLPYGNV